MCPAFCAPPAPDRRRPLPSASAHHLTRHRARLTAAGVPAHRHGDLDDSCELSACLDSKLLVTNMTNTREPRRFAGDSTRGPACQRDICPASLPRVGPHPSDTC